MMYRFCILLIYAYITSAVAQNSCCPGVNNTLVKRGCTTGPLTGIKCIKKYMVESQYYSIVNGFLIEDGDIPIPPEQYCIAKDPENSTNDVALVCLGTQEYIGESQSLFIFRACCALLSVVFLTATLVVYILVPELRDLQGKCLIHMISVFTLAMLLLSIMQFGLTLSHVCCHFFGYMAFVSFLATFSWLNIISFHIWKTVAMPTCLGTNKQWHIIYCVYGYGLPFIIFLSAVIAHHVSGDHVKPGIGGESCWLNGTKATWVYFYGPIAFLLVVNVIFFLLTVKTLWKDMKNCNNTTKIRSMKYKCLLYIKLFFIMGLSWIFEVFSFAFQKQYEVLDYIWLVTDFVNGLQGILIFLILVVFRKRAIRGLAQRGLFCIQLPRQWRTLHDEEEEEEAEEAKLRNGTIAERRKPNGNQIVA